MESIFVAFVRRKEMCPVIRRKVGVVTFSTVYKTPSWDTLYVGREEEEEGEEEEGEEGTANGELEVDSGGGLGRILRRDFE
ncbi:hypothetical protein EYF80_054225 [Liparis tanakae]|uniref:Uncharacterized protein n=1 Tax=Liparis tanakae TaxID=230148 RepID=A0A4Z2F555_9TELE|nr:hypothetical protein EYF80_054225 [Liparis tanakae]